MLSNLLAKHHLVLKKGKNIYILSHLAIGYLYQLRLWLHKKIHRIHHPIIHYYAVCWNEERMLPFLFDHYGPFVDRFIIYDNHSSDRSPAIIDSFPKATRLPFYSNGFSDTRHNEIKNTCWKHSRGKADFVIVCDIDEFLFFLGDKETGDKEIRRQILSLKKRHITVVTPTGFDMYSPSYPPPFSGDRETSLTAQVKHGLRAPLYDKSILFDPHSIIEINYMPGSHECHPWGRIKRAGASCFYLLHYKNLGIDWLLLRNRQYAERLSNENLEKKYGLQYLRSEETIRADFQLGLQQSENIIP